MKFTLSFLFFLGFSLLAIAADAAPHFYGQTIYTSSVTDEIAQRSVKDLQFYLEKATGRPFKVEPFTGQTSEGIYVLLNERSSIAGSWKDKLNKGTIEDFIISGDNLKLTLLSTHPAGFSRSIYTYLDRIGIKWYFPGEEWTYVPSLSNITLTKQEYVTPSFNMRNFFGTGSILPARSIDPERSLQAGWEDWKRRNRMGGDVVPGGHYGETFNAKYKALLEANPEWLALVNGKRVSWNPEAKWCISNKQLRAIYLKDRVEEFQSRWKKAKYKNEKIVVSVDPADGYGECECDQCKKLGSISNRYFLMANEVAKAIRPLAPAAAYVNIYAYNTHAEVPTFAIEPNVLVQVIPYAFQKEKAPNQLIQDWRKHHNYLMLYDYYGIPDWHMDLPLTGGWTANALVDKMKYWQTQNIRGFMLESSFGIASAGMGLFYMGRLGWDMKENISATTRSMYENLFGSASKEAKKYFEKLSEFRGSVDIPYLLDVLGRASSNDPSVQKRLASLKSYVHYLVLYYRFTEAAPAQKEAALEELMQYNWSAYPLRMVHTTRIGELLTRKSADVTAFGNQWNIFEPLGAKIKSLKLIDSRTIETDFSNDRKAYPLQQGLAYTNPEKAVRFINKSTIREEPNPQGLTLMEFPETFVIPGADGYIRFMLKVNEGSANNNQQTVEVTLIDTVGGKQVSFQTVDINREWKKMAIKATAGKSYKLYVKPRNWFKIYFAPSQWVAFRSIPTYSMMGKLYFYVPEGTTHIYYGNNAADQPKIADPSGNPVAAEKVKNGNLFRLAVNKNAAGKWWSVSSTEYKTLQFFHQPNLFFTQPGYSIQ